MKSKTIMLKASFVLLAGLALQAPASADDGPPVSSVLKKMLGNLPLESRDQLQKMTSALRKTSCGGGLTGCYSVISGDVQLYFFTSAGLQQTFIIVVDRTMAMPKMFSSKVQAVLGQTKLRSLMISISTSDFDLTTDRMPPELKQIVKKSYFDVSTLSFASGVQMAAHADLGGPIKGTMEAFGVRGDELTMRAGVVLPIPPDVANAAAAGAGVAKAVADGAKMSEAAAEAAKLEAFVEFQFAPGAKLPLLLPPMNLSDATFYLNNNLTFGYKGNAAFKGVGDKKFLIQFQTPLTPLGEMDMIDYGYRVSTPADFTLEDTAYVVAAMATPDHRLDRYGGGFIGGISKYKQQLLDAVKPLSAFKLKNEHPAPEYRFGDRTKPWPDDNKYYNFAVMGPLAPNGPYLASGDNLIVMGLTLGKMQYSAGFNGFQGSAGNEVNLKLGPLGRVTFKMMSSANVTQNTQEMGMQGNFLGQKVEVTIGSKVGITVSPSCVNPFEIKASVDFKPDLNLDTLFESQGGANVDPSRIGGCVGKELEAAYKKIAGEYKTLGGYTAAAANAELKKISDEAERVAKATQKAAEDAQKEYNRVKDGARDTANKATHAAANAFRDAGNAFKRIGQKKKHRKEPDPKFAASVFDWDYYYDIYPDVVKSGGDLSQHWRDGGFSGGRRGSLEFYADWYWGHYSDVQALCPTRDRQCVLQHWLDFGLAQGRQGSAEVSVESYLNRYPDLQNAFGKRGYLDAMEHWLNTNGERTAQPEVVVAGPLAGVRIAGGGGDKAWSDLDFCAGQALTGWRLSYGKTLDRAQFFYENRGWSGVEGGSDNFRVDKILPAGEYVVRVDYRSGKLIDNISFITNRGNSFGPYGGDGGGPGSYSVSPGEKLGCLSGTAGGSINQIVFTSTGPR